MAKDWVNFAIYKLHDENLEKFSAKYLSGKLIDIGCGSKPYKKMLSKYVSSHVGVDHFETMHDKESVDLWGTAYQIPVEDSSFDCAISTAVLEHLEEPSNAIKECQRVLKQNSFAIYSIPFIWHLHEEPRDFYRYTEYGIKYLFEKNGFEIIELKALSGFWVTFSVLLTYNISRLNRGIIKILKIIPLIGYTIQNIALFLEKFDKSEKWTWMYMVVVRKIK